MQTQGLSSERVRGLAELSGMLERGVVSEGDFDELLEKLRAFYEGVAIAIAGSTDFVGPARSLGLPREWPEIHRRYQAQDPSLELLAQRPLGAAFTTESDLSDEVREQELFVRYRGYGFGDGLVSRIHSPFFSELFLIVYRERGQRPFDDEERLWLRLLQPHLAGALAARRALSHLRSIVGAAALPAAQRVLAQVALSWPGPRVEWNRPARALFSERLGPIARAGWARIEQLILRASRRFEEWQFGGRSQLLLSGLRIEFASVPPRPGERRRVAALLLAEEEPPPAPLRGEELLSPRQREVAREAARGKTCAQIARQLGIAAETARYHLKEAFRRLGIRRRAELARLALRG